MSARVGQIDLGIITPYIQVYKQTSIEAYQDIFEGNRHRIYSLAFWMTDNEMAAEEVMTSVFRRAFAQSPKPTAEHIDRALVTEIREIMPIGSLTLESETVTTTSGVRRNTKRIHLERAVVQLPGTERLIFLMHDVEGYDHPRIARTLAISEVESREGLFQARLKMRKLIAEMTENS